MDTTERSLHLASQYLASAARQYMTAMDDDSHTAITWDRTTATFSGRVLPDGGHLVLGAASLSLEWTGGLTRTLDLIGRTHGEVIVWLHHVAVIKGYEEYEFSSPYYLGKGWENPLRQYEDFDTVKADEFIERRNVADIWCAGIARKYGEEQEILIWPHHFDTAVLLDPSVKGIKIGAGLAMPDEVHDGHYFYVAGYKKDKAIETSGLPALTTGSWNQGAFAGAVLPYDGSSDDERKAFAIQAIEILLAS